MPRIKIRTGMPSVQRDWYQAPSTLKLMIDRLVCADGGNPDPTSTGGKDAKAPRRWSSKAGTIHAIWPAAHSRWSCTATRRASGRCAGA
jgi:hypothetical protein